MSLPFDATLKELVRRYPSDWLAALELDAQLPVRALDVDLSTVSAGADTVLGIGDPLSSLVHIEFQSSRDRSLSRRLLMYNALLHERFEVPVHSTVVLLRRQADEPAMNGRLQYETQGGRAGIDFRFEVMRIWQRPATTMLMGGLGMVPLAPLGELPSGSPRDAVLTGLLRRIDERLEAELPPAEAQRLLMAAWVLIGMRVPRSKLKLFQEALTMVDLRDSSTYQLIVEEGMAKGMEKGMERGMEKGKAAGLRTMLLQIGARRLGSPATAVQEPLNAIDDIGRLQRMGERVLDVATWQELLDTA
jgi:predicted transposase YdaD